MSMKIDAAKHNAACRLVQRMLNESATDGMDEFTTLYAMGLVIGLVAQRASTSESQREQMIEAFTATARLAASLDQDDWLRA